MRCDLSSEFFDHFSVVHCRAVDHVCQYDHSSVIPGKWKCQQNDQKSGSVREKSCWGKMFIAIFMFGATSAFNGLW